VQHRLWRYVRPVPETAALRIRRDLRRDLIPFRRSIMADAKPKMIVQYTLNGEYISHARTDIETRDVDVTIDEPTQRGETNMGLAPTETVVAALIGCNNVIGQRAGEKHGVHFKDLTVDALADFDRRGVMFEE
jgi:putative redox protein